MWARGATNTVKLNSKAEADDPTPPGRLFWVPISSEEQLFGGDELMFHVEQSVAAIGPGTFVHCGSDSRSKSKLMADFNDQGGQDRTGLIIAVWRVKVQHWSKADAWAEMKRFGFHDEPGLLIFWDQFKP